MSDEPTEPATGPVSAAERAGTSRLWTGLIIGLLIGVLAQAVIASVAPNRVLDTDADGIGDELDLASHGDARLRVIVAGVQHDALDEDTIATFVFGYHDDGSVAGTPGAQTCFIEINMLAESTTSYPTGDAAACIVGMDDYVRRGVSFEYAMSHPSNQSADGVARWDLVAGDAPETAGQNLSADPELLFHGTQILLDGRADGDAHAWNAAVRLVLSPVVVEAE